MKRPRQRSTPAGEHRPVLLDEVLAALDPKPGQVVVDTTVGWAGHSAELLRRVGPSGRLVGIDFDPDNLPRARERLDVIGYPFSLHHGNFAGLQTVLAAEGITAVDAVLADLGMSSMQVDDAERGFSYARDGPLDMRMDRSRGRTAAQLLATISEDDLRQALHDLGDEPEAARVAQAIVRARQSALIERTADLARIIREATESDPKRPWRLHPQPGQWNLHPAARTFQALRILVNRELANLEQLLRVLPAVLKPGGRAVIISFHSGEDRLVKAAFRDGMKAGVYGRTAADPIRARFEERTANPRSRSAKLRWAERARSK
ncbi:MAG TPA: 16S rRNA (cytosine(1402)-N(4))-methyltransferase RsmH [Gemmataceae bacterium]|nr:16S rRNA (cytosine(1402)-N(4))-methyltransferase RsmH [Gemmataceae bacterium]